MQFSDQDPAGRRFIGWDFAADLRATPDVSIESATFSATVVTGTDNNAGAILSGVPVITGTKVSMLRTGGVAGVTYRIRVEAVTSDGQTLVESALLKIATAE